MTDIEKYAITVTFAKLIHKTPKGMFRETIQHLQKTLAKSCDYEIYPEFRIVTGDIHYHGTIAIKDKIKWYKQTLPSLKRMGYVKVKKIDDLQGWTKYLQKEYSITKGILDIELPIKEYIRHIEYDGCTCIICKMEYQNINIPE